MSEPVYDGGARFKRPRPILVELQEALDGSDVPMLRKLLNRVGETGPMSEVLKKAIKDHLAAMEAADKTGDYLDSVIDILRKHEQQRTP